MDKQKERRLKEVRKLRDDASRLMEKGKHAKALDKYLRLEEVDPEEAGWSKRVADCYRRLGRREDELEALIRAADGYSRIGYLLKAVAVCKLVLAIDPKHTETLERMANLHAGQSTGLDRFHKAALGLEFRAPAAGAQPPAAEAAESAQLQVAPTAADAPAAVELARPPLQELDLNQVMDSRLRSNIPAGSSGIYELKLDELDSFELQQSEEAGVEAAAEEPASVTPADLAREAASELLPRTPLFSEVSQDSLMRLISRVSLRELAPGDIVYREGDPADALLVVADGKVEVVKEGPPRVRLAQLGEGEFFGEIGLVSDTPRQCTVCVLHDTQLLVMDRSAVGELIEQEPGFLKVLLRFLRYRLIAPLLQTNPLFAPFSGEERRALARKFQFLELESGAVLIEEGKRAHGLFVLLSGAAEVIRGEGDLLATLHPGDVFGEMSLLTQNPAVGTVRTTTKAFALEMPAERFTETIMINPQVLMYVSELAEQRRLQNEAAADNRLEFR